MGVTHQVSIYLRFFLPTYLSLLAMGPVGEVVIIVTRSDKRGTKCRSHGHSELLIQTESAVKELFNIYFL